MFAKFVWGAVRFRRKRLLLAFSALAVAATLATALLSVYSDLERKMRVEFRSYGANMVIAPAGRAVTVPLGAVAEAERLGAVAAPFLYSIGRLRGEAVVLTGIDFDRAAPLTNYWRTEGARAAGRGECLIGISAASHFGLGVGQTATLQGGPCVIRGLVSTGGPEDEQVILPFEAAAHAAGIQNAASVVQVRADGQRLQQIRSALSRSLPESDIRVLHAVAETEANVVLKVRTSLYLLSALILVITVLCVTSNFSALVIERSREIGILKAIGAAEKNIAGLLLTESLILGLVSTVAGYAVGLLVAYWIGQSVFSGGAAPFNIGVDYRVFLPVAAVTLSLACMATLLAAARIWHIEPAAILRGE